MSLSLHNGDITKLKVDAIVNAANAQLAPGGELAAQGGDLSVISCVFGDAAEAVYRKALAA